MGTEWFERDGGYVWIPIDKNDPIEPGQPQFDQLAKRLGLKESTEFSGTGLLQLNEDNLYEDTGFTIWFKSNVEEEAYAKPLEKYNSEVLKHREKLKDLEIDFKNKVRVQVDSRAFSEQFPNGLDITFSFATKEEAKSFEKQLDSNPTALSEAITPTIAARLKSDKGVIFSGFGDDGTIRYQSVKEFLGQRIIIPDYRTFTENSVQVASMIGVPTSMKDLYIAAGTIIIGGAVVKAIIEFGPSVRIPKARFGNGLQPAFAGEAGEIGAELKYNAQGNAGGVKPQWVDLNKLSPPRSRPFADPQKLKDLGPFKWYKYEPITVLRRKGILTIQDGMTRVEAARRAGLNSLPAYIYDR